MHSTLSRSAALSLALAAMLLRAFLPDGWMLGAQAHGALFTICSVQPPAPHDQKIPLGEGHIHVPCAFAAASTLAPPTLVDLTLGAGSTALHVEEPFDHERPHSVRPFRPNIARAPPAFA